MQQIKPGDSIAGRFRIIELIGRGGFSVVYRAYQENMQRHVALKILKPSISNDENVVERFRREALFASHLSHPNTITLFDYGRTESGLCYIAMELLEGRELGAVVRDNEGLELARVWSVLAQATQSLAEAHKLGLIHRDLKPENIYLVQQDDEELVKVLDFGLSKAIRTISSAGPGAMTPLTQEGKVFGTPLYMAPEQAMDKPISPAIDVYALGHIAYEMIVGQARYGDMSTAMDIMLRQIYDPPLELSGEHSDTPFAELITQCTKKEPEERISDATVLYDRLVSSRFVEYMPAGPHRDRLTERGAAHRSWGGGLGTESSFVDEENAALGFERELGSFHEILDDVEAEGELRVILINGPRGGGRTQLLRDFLEDVREQNTATVIHRHSYLDGKYKDRGLAADIAQIERPNADTAITDGFLPMLGTESDPGSDVATELTQRESAFFGNLDGKRETMLSKTARLFRDEARDRPVVWALERLERMDAFTLAFLNWFYQELNSEPAPVLIVATVSRADLVDRAGLLRYTQAILGGTEPTVRRFFISRALDEQQNEGSGAGPLTETLGPTNKLSVEQVTGGTEADAAAADGHETFNTLGGVGSGSSSEDQLRSLFDRTLGLIAQLGDEVPIPLWEKVRNEILEDYQPGIIEFVVDRAERFGILDRKNNTISFGRPTFAETLRSRGGETEGEEPLVDLETRVELAEAMLDHYDRPGRETVELAVKHFVDAEQSTAAIMALHNAGKEAFQGLDLDAAREFYLRLQHLLEQLGDQELEEVRGELDTDLARVWLRIGETHGALDEHGAAEDALERAAKFAVGRSPAVRGRALKLLGDIQSAQGQYKSAEKNYDAAGEAFRGAGRLPGAAAAASLRGETLLQRGNVDEARELLDETLAEADRLEMPLVAARTHFRLGRAAHREAELEIALGHFDAAADGFEALERFDEAVRSLCKHGDAAFGARHFEIASRSFARAQKAADNVRRYGDVFPTLGLARSLTAMGEFEKAAGCIEDPDAPDRHARSAVRRVEWARYRGDLLFYQSEYPAALEWYAEMKNDAREVGRTDLFLDALLRAAFIHYHAETYDDVAECFDQAAKFVGKFGNHSQTMTTQILELYLNRATDGFPNQTDHLAEHLEAAKDKEERWPYALTCLCMADIRAANGHYPAAEELLSRAFRGVAASGKHWMSATIGHRLDRLAALQSDDAPPSLSGVLIGGPIPPELDALHPDRIYGSA